MLKIAAIDVGSNAMRMMVGEVDESWQVTAVENIRLPVRLGQDIFSKGYLESETIQQTESAFLRFKHIADNYGVQRMRAVATSAAREASNGDLLIERVLRASGIELEFISGGGGGTADPSGSYPHAESQKQTHTGRSGISPSCQSFWATSKKELSHCPFTCRPLGTNNKKHSDSIFCHFGLAETKA